MSEDNTPSTPVTESVKKVKPMTIPEIDKKLEGLRVRLLRENDRYERTMIKCEIDDMLDARLKLMK